MLGFTSMIDFLVNNHIIGPESKAACISEPVVNVLAAEHHSDQLMIIFLVLK